MNDTMPPINDTPAPWWVRTWRLVKRPFTLAARSISRARLARSLQPSIDSWEPFYEASQLVLARYTDLRYPEADTNVAEAAVELAEAATEALELCKAIEPDLRDKATPLLRALAQTTADTVDDAAGFRIDLQDWLADRHRDYKARKREAGLLDSQR